jgi:DNA-binding MarR family transcriptional regulator
MTLAEELGFRKPIEEPAHEALLEVVVTSDLLSKEGERVVRPFGITEPQFNVLMLLAWQSSGGEMDQTSLGRMLVVNRSNVTGLVDRLEQAGLVSRSLDPSDRRVRLLRLTVEGRRVLARAEEAYVERVHEVMSVLSAAEQRQLGNLLGRIRRAAAEGAGGAKKRAGASVRGARKRK